MNQKVLNIILDIQKQLTLGYDQKTIVSNTNYLAEQAGMSFTAALMFSDAVNTVLSNNDHFNTNELYHLVGKEVKKALLTYKQKSSNNKNISQ